MSGVGFREGLSLNSLGSGFREGCPHLHMLPPHSSLGSVPLLLKLPGVCPTGQSLD